MIRTNKQTGVGIIAAFPECESVGRALRRLHDDAFDMREVSIIGRGFEATEPSDEPTTCFPSTDPSEIEARGAPTVRSAIASRGEKGSMVQRSCFLCLIMAAVCTAAQTDEPEARPNEVPGWGRVIDPWRDCDVALDRDNERLKIQVPGTPHVLSAEVPQLSMNAPRVMRRVRGDFTAGVHVLGRLEPGPTKTTHYDPYHGAGLIVWQDPSNYLRLERAVGFNNGRHHPYINYELRAGGLLAVTRGVTIEAGPLWLKLRRKARRSRPGTATMAGDGSHFGASRRPSPIASRSASSPSTLPGRRCRPSWRC